MNCQRNVNSILPKELAHTFSYIVAIFIHNHFESPNILRNVISVAYSTSVLELYTRHFHPVYFLVSTMSKKKRVLRTSVVHFR
jgi:hypothetical protein